MLERLEELGVPEPWRLAEPLAVAGVDEAWLAEVAELAGPATGAALRWVAASLTARGLAADLQESTARMCDLVTAIKAYAYMDRGGLSRSTSTRGSRRRSSSSATSSSTRSIDVVRDYDRDAAEADRARPGAQPGLDQPHRQRHRRAGRERDAHHRDARATATVRARRRSPTTAPASRPTSSGASSIRSSPPSRSARGPGLGLDTARQIVEEHHGGTLGFDTEPGGTTFHVWLP